eukprot:11323788-Prorocentrum_lima.AAC.1
MPKAVFDGIFKMSLAQVVSTLRGNVGQGNVAQAPVGALPSDAPPTLAQQVCAGQMTPEPESSPPSQLHRSGE